MARKLIKFTPEQMGYKDRGKMKWMGLMLSDHTDLLKSESILKEPVDIKPKNKMTEYEITKILQAAYLQRLPVTLQRDILINGNYEIPVKCMVNGYNGYKIFITFKDKSKYTVELNQIRNIELMDVEDWYKV